MRGDAPATPRVVETVEPPLPRPEEVVDGQAGWEPAVPTDTGEVMRIAALRFAVERPAGRGCPTRTLEHYFRERQLALDAHPVRSRREPRYLVGPPLPNTPVDDKEEADPAP